MQSPLPGNEAGRSRVLWNYRILDTPPEERFDDLVRVATYICGTPIGLVGLIDAVSDGLCSAGPDRSADAHPVGPGAAGDGASGRPARFGIESRKGFV